MIDKNKFFLNLFTQQSHYLVTQRVIEFFNTLNAGECKTLGCKKYGFAPCTRAMPMHQSVPHTTC